MYYRFSYRQSGKDRLINSDPIKQTSKHLALKDFYDQINIDRNELEVVSILTYPINVWQPTNRIAGSKQ